MKVNRLLPLLVATSTSLFLASCGNNPPSPNPDQTVIKAAKPVNPYPPGSYEHFRFGSYPGTTRTWKSQSVLAVATPTNTAVHIDLQTQRGFLMVGQEVAMDYRVSSGSSKHKTPAGEYTIIEKLKDKRSNLYGKLLDSSGSVVKTNADARKDTIPEGGKFLGASMPYWMRLTRTGVGMHQGDVNRRYASHGCIRTHSSAVKILFAKTQIGTPVVVAD